jgi:hypothetical protein
MTGKDKASAVIALARPVHPPDAAQVDARS